MHRRTSSILTTLIVATLVVTTGCNNPAQFLARMYTEVLGRAPDTGGWVDHSRGFFDNGCDHGRLLAKAVDFFGSPEYAARGYSPEQTVLTAYRALLGREPDLGGFGHFVSLMKNQGWTAVNVAWDIGLSGEFQGLVANQSICWGVGYRRDMAGSRPIDIGYGVWTQAQLQACINAGTTCSIPQSTVIYVTSAITIPAGKTLQTIGNPATTAYAKQARIVKDSAFQNSLVFLAAGATIRNVWLDGQSHRYNPTADANYPNVWFSGGTGSAVVAQVRSDNPLNRSHVLAEKSSAGDLTVRDSLLVSYSATHPGIGDFGAVDGIQAHHSHVKMLRNGIIEPSDVGIVIFGRGPTQASEASENTILNAGVSAMAALGFDTTGSDCVDCPFSGPGMHHNTIITSRSQHLDIILAVGTAPWVAPPAACGAGVVHCGRGAVMRENRTIWGDNNHKIATQVAIVVDGMRQATTNTNSLFFEIAPVGGRQCFDAAAGHGVVNHLVHAQDGNLLGGGDRAMHGCVVHP